MSLVTYIWAGTDERHPDEIPLVENDQPVLDDGEPVMVENPEAGQPLWCFAYGEREWMSGQEYDELAAAASSEDEFGDPQEPVGQINCETGEALQ
ncbi:hypothetical protein [Marinimicrobium sp. ABcell2]|uniref:hypothetical protein n=1 Tax=Marinimicrobium sp. ABcell2 TaxID=3069751 RepID=UPI0027B825B8|nr:hypothetical protein [Marinimicrobium sp. ABcell2]MDQ2075469.1 hypothetical protein [Marinimicrobium sp. ABcell2]